MLIIHNSTFFGKFLLFFKKIYFKILVIILIIIGSFSVSFANEDEDADYNETKKSIDSYIDNQLEKIDLKEIQQMQAKAEEERKKKSMKSLKDPSIQKQRSILILSRQNIYS